MLLAVGWRLEQVVQLRRHMLEALALQGQVETKRRLGRPICIVIIGVATGMRSRINLAPCRPEASIIFKRQDDPGRVYRMLVEPISRSLEDKGVHLFGLQLATTVRSPVQQQPR